jgi:hypothetical protein
MKTFNFYRDQKCSIWQRMKFNVEAETYEEAVKKVLQMEEDCNYDEVDPIYDLLFETINYLTRYENHGERTTEIYSVGTDKVIFENGKRPSLI